MSFSVDVKDDLIKTSNSSKNEDLLELEAMIRFGGEISFGLPMKLKFTCNNMGVIRRFVKLYKEFYEIEYEILSRVVNRLDNHTVFTCEINNDCSSIIKDLNLIGSSSSLRNNELSQDELTAYLRGAFLVRGSVNDPIGKSSHLEIISTSETEILFIQKIMNIFELNARLTKRKNYLVCYIKAKEVIGDFLYRVGATQSMAYYEDVLITKEITANAKRTINLNIANQDKTNSASKEQLENIKLLKYSNQLEHLDSKLLMVMKVREDHPEHSLTQLLDVIHEEYDPNLTKSGLNHRFRKIKELANHIRENK